MQNSTLLVLLGLFALPDSAFAQIYPPPRSYPVPAQYYPIEPAQLVRDWYRRYLGREGDPGGVATWVESLRSGNAPEATLASILASDEYTRRAGGSPENVVRTLFLDLTGRQPAPGEFGYWVNRFYQGERIDAIYDLLLRYPQNWQSQPASVPLPDDSYYYDRPYRYYRR